ncbi:protein MAK16 [Fistulifera solaris]|jgi:protein MAK16|uniref:Protein MAK16 homolog n=1 Tax=Fistulifera solaris TaxID=1519565 RepID=A0A1Z5JGG7_FISSO|nr:protein MAK16 [Fistulifera solaris]|eukprot:GAX13079.1 protein MAK16 [Fistulifera solaris]
MQHDEMIWQVINHQFCSYKTTIGKALSDKTHFCRHPYSVTGLCNRTSCPLANSRYATIREEEGKISLYIKTVERAHSPKNLWERITLSRNYSKALAQIDEHLAYFPKVLIHRNKQRLTKIHQYLIRMRKIELKARAGRKAKVVGIHRKIEQREERRERKALIAAKLEKSIEKELVQRLAKGAYGDIYNFPEMSYNKALDHAEEEEEVEEETESESEEEEEEGLVEYVEDLDSEEEEMEDDMEDMDYMGDGKWGKGSDDDSDESNDSSSDSDDEKPKKPKKENRRRGPRVEIEYEEEREDEQQEMVAATNDW